VVVAGSRFDKNPTELLEEGTGGLGKEVGSGNSVEQKALFRFADQMNSNILSPMFRQDQETGQPRIQVLIPGKIIEYQADHSDELFVLDCNQ
jgi:hypothetical protein